MSISKSTFVLLYDLNQPQVCIFCGAYHFLLFKAASIGFYFSKSQFFRTKGITSTVKVSRCHLIFSCPLVCIWELLRFSLHVNYYCREIIPTKARYGMVLLLSPRQEVPKWIAHKSCHQSRLLESYWKRPKSCLSGFCDRIQKDPSFLPRAGPNGRSNRLGNARVSSL